MYHGQLVRFGSNGHVRSSRLDIPPSSAPGAPEFSPCAFNGFDAVGEFAGRILVTAHYPTGGEEPGSQVLSFATDGSAGRYAFDASDGPKDASQVSVDGTLIFIDAGHQWRSVVRSTPGATHGTAVDIAAPGPEPLGTLGDPEAVNTLTNSYGKIYVSYNMDASNYDQWRSYVATIDATGAHNIDLEATWVEAGPGGTLAYITDQSHLVFHDQRGTDTALADSATSATWAGT